MTRFRLPACFIALMIVTTGCGFFGSPNDKREDAKGKTIGGNLPDPAVTPTTKLQPTTTTSKPRTTLDPNRCVPGDDTSEVRYNPGLVLEFKVSTTCATRSSNINFRLKVTNTSNRDVRYNPNQFEFFSIKPPRGENKSSWRDRDCTPLPTGDRRKPARSLTPGASLEFTNTYPGPDGVADRERCRKLESGAYDAHAVFLLCEGDAFEDNYCDISKADQLFAQPLRINFAR